MWSSDHSDHDWLFRSHHSYDESCHTYEWVMSHIWMSHVTHMNESCHTYESFLDHIIHIRSQHSYLWHDPWFWPWLIVQITSFIWWVMSHIWMSHVTHNNTSCHTYESFIDHIIHICDMTHDSGHERLIILIMNNHSDHIIRMRDKTHVYVWHDSSIHADMTHWNVRHDWFIRVTWLMHMCDMTIAHVWHDSCVCVTWLIHTGPHDSLIRATRIIHSCDRTYSQKSLPSTSSSSPAMKWARWVGSLKL